MQNQKYEHKYRTQKLRYKYATNL